MSFYRSRWPQGKRPAVLQCWQARRQRWLADCSGSAGGSRRCALPNFESLYCFSLLASLRTGFWFLLQIASNDLGHADVLAQCPSGVLVVLPRWQRDADEHRRIVRVERRTAASFRLLHVANSKPASSWPAESNYLPVEEIATTGLAGSTRPALTCSRFSLRQVRHGAERRRTIDAERSAKLCPDGHEILCEEI